MTDSNTKPEPKPKVEEMISSTEIERVENFQFRAKYDLPKAMELIMDEPPQFGGDGAGPNASRVLASAIGQCLSSSLIFCLNKARIPAGGLKTVINTKIARNEDNLLRVVNIDVEMNLELEDPAQTQKSERCMELFEKYCIVTDSIRNGIPINVNVKID